MSIQETTNSEREVVEGNERPGIVERNVLERRSDKNLTLKQDLIADEVAVAFAYNGQSHAVMMASPIDLYDFAVGFSVTERIVDSVDDILDIDIRDAKKGITIQLRIKQIMMERLERQRRQMSGRSGCGICGIIDLEAAIPKLEPMVQTDLPDHTIINQAVEILQSNQLIQNSCGGVHCAGMFDRTGKLLAIREDVGRHNALDKLIGAQLDNIEPEYFVLMSSRASHELIAKVAIAGIGTLVTISAATTLAIEVANKINLNLIGFIRGSRQVIYSATATSNLTQK
ncbi:MAG: formate dehydrogenase accessory sulfurtransferase FdhD [Proteobacteria bacterium]|jgi:FdhD protein|nr:formate dehydrogenase accessory sulfurtransferase FdhD [Pseudomonadota bacterium]